MRLIMFVISLSISAAIFAWKLNTFATSANASPFEKSGGAGLSDAMMAKVMGIFGSTEKGNAAMAAMNTDINFNGKTIALKNGMPDTEALKASIQKNMQSFGFGGRTRGPSDTRPKDFSARFQKVPKKP